MPESIRVIAPAYCRLGRSAEMCSTNSRRQTRMLANELGVIGLINVQYAIFEGEIYILEVNPRASRTIPFVSKAIGVPLAKLAARVMAGRKLAELGFDRRTHTQS